MMINKLAPSILSADFNRLGADIRAAGEAGADMIHFDVMDGLFVPSISFGIPVLKSVRSGTDMFLDCHLMIEEPFRYIDAFADAGADSVTIHVEACHEYGCTETLNAIRERGLKNGISLNPSTPVINILPYLGMVDMVLVMSVEPGFGGQKFIQSSLDKIRELSQLREEGDFGFDIQVDGGVNVDNLKSILGAGANVIVSGSSIFKGNIEENVHRFKEIMG